MNEIMVYTKSGCPQCVATKRALQSAAIPYRSVDVTADPAARAEVLSLGYSAVPVVVLADGRHWAGFRPDKIARLVAHKSA